MKQAFDKNGYHIERSLFSEAECKKILKNIRAHEYRYPLIWEKGWAASNPAWKAIACTDRLVDIVEKLIGKNIVLWGASLIVRVPKQVHQWHDDMESASGEGFVSIWMGIKDTDEDTSLKVIPGSHKFNRLILQEAKDHGVLRQHIEDDNVTEWSQKIQPGSHIENLDTRNGDALFFDGRLWHGSKNRSSNKNRIALLLQYARSENPVRIPKFSHYRWPMEYFTEPKPPCLVIRGSSLDSTNFIMPGPHSSATTSKNGINTLIETLDLKEYDLGDQNLKIFSLIKGPSTDLRLMECHYSVLAPGKMPHPPHIHDEEEIQMIVQGEAELIAEDEKGSNKMERFLAKPGDFIYHPANWRHTYENLTDKPVVCAIFKWFSDEYHSTKTLRSTFVKCADTLTKDRQRTNHIQFDPFLRGKTGYLRTLEAHMATLYPGQGYEPHIDGHDVGIIHFEGQVETLGETITQPSFIYYSAGQKHGMRNTGNTVSKHIAFEFHGKHGQLFESAKDRRRRKLKESITNPSILISYIKRRIRKKLKKPGDVWPEAK